MPFRLYPDCTDVALSATLFRAAGRPAVAGLLEAPLAVCQDAGDCPHTSQCRKLLRISRETSMPRPSLDLNGYRTESPVADRQGNAVQRRRIELPEGDDALGQLVGNWRRLPERPQPDHLVPGPLLRVRGLAGHLHLIDVADADPAGWHFRVFGHKVSLPDGRDMSGRPLHEMGPEVYSRSLIADYYTARLLASPAAFQVSRLVAGNGRAFCRLVLPLFDGGARVSHLLVAVGRVSEPVFDA